MLRCEVADPTGGATHYYATSIKSPPWTVGAKFTVQRRASVLPRRAVKHREKFCSDSAEGKNSLGTTNGKNRAMATSHIRTAMTLVTLSGITQTAFAWAEERGLRWNTVEVRRHRGANWEKALRPIAKRKRPALRGFSYGHRPLDNRQPFGRKATA